MNQSDLNLDDLRSKIDGLVIEPGSFEYAALPKVNNARFDHIQPQVVVLCSTAADVAQTVDFIRSQRLETATRCGGHCFAGRSSTPGLLIDVSAINSVSLSNGTASIGAGARLGEVYSVLLANGMTIPGGSCGRHCWTHSRRGSGLAGPQVWSDIRPPYRSKDRCG